MDAQQADRRANAIRDATGTKSPTLAALALVASEGKRDVAFALVAVLSRQG
jgi:hypothetical protein